MEKTDFPCFPSFPNFPPKSVIMYIELKCIVNPVENGNDILTAFLADIGYESFVETETGLLAYIQESEFDIQKLEFLQQDSNACGFVFSYSYEIIEEQNWNAVWESNYNPVLIDNTCYIRAPFHPSREDVKYEIIIEPKMSFGTAHHQTTAQMISYLLNEDCENKKVLDMGSGTGVLSILAAMRGAKEVLAIDNDTWAYNNCCENIEKNCTYVVKAVLGDASFIGNEKYDIILANINRNIILRDINIYANALNNKGILFLSGFYLHPDLTEIKEAAIKNNLLFDSCQQQDNWVAARFYFELKISRI